MRLHFLKFSVSQLKLFFQFSFHKNQKVAKKCACGEKSKKYLSHKRFSFEMQNLVRPKEISSSPIHISFKSKSFWKFLPMSGWLNLFIGQCVVIATNGHRNQFFLQFNSIPFQCIYHSFSVLKRYAMLHRTFWYKTENENIPVHCWAIEFGNNSQCWII